MLQAGQGGKTRAREESSPSAEHGSSRSVSGSPTRWRSRKPPELGCEGSGEVSLLVCEAVERREGFGSLQSRGRKKGGREGEGSVSSAQLSIFVLETRRGADSICLPSGVCLMLTAFQNRPYVFSASAEGKGEGGGEGRREEVSSDFFPSPLSIFLSVREHKNELEPNTHCWFH